MGREEIKGSRLGKREIDKQRRERNCDPFSSFVTMKRSVNRFDLAGGTRKSSKVAQGMLKKKKKAVQSK